MNERNTVLYKNRFLILFSKRAHSLFLVWEINRETYTQREDFFLFHPSSGSQGATLAPLSSRIVRNDLSLWSTAFPWVDSRFFGLSLNLTAWFPSRGLLPVTPLLDQTTLTRCSPSLLNNHHVTACQSTQGH